MLRVRRARAAFRRRLAAGLPGGEVELRAWLERCGATWVRRAVVDRCVDGSPEPLERDALVAVLRRIGLGAERSRVDDLRRGSSATTELRSAVTELIAELEPSSAANEPGDFAGGGDGRRDSPRATVETTEVVPASFAVVPGDSPRGPDEDPDPAPGDPSVRDRAGEDRSPELERSVSAERDPSGRDLGPLAAGPSDPGPSDAGTVDIDVASGTTIDRWCVDVLRAIRDAAGRARDLSSRLHGIDQPEIRVGLFARLEHHRQRFGLSPGVVYRRLLTAEAEPELRDAALELVVAEARFADVLLLQFLRHGAGDEDLRRVWQRAWIHARTRGADRTVVRPDARCWVTSCSGSGRYLVLVEQALPVGRTLLRFDFGAGGVLTDASVGPSATGLRSDLARGGADGCSYAVAPLGAVDAMVVTAARSAFELQGAIPGEILAAIGQLDPVVDDRPRPAWGWVVQGPALGLDRLLGRPEYRSWRFEAAELQAHGIEAPREQSPHALARWRRRAAVRLDVAVVRRRLVSMLEHMRAWHLWRCEVQCARRCSIAAAELVSDFVAAPLVQQLLDRAAVVGSNPARTDDRVE